VETQITAGVGRLPDKEPQVIAWVIVDNKAQQEHFMEPLEARLFASLLVAMADRCEYERLVASQQDEESVLNRRNQFKVIPGGIS
jgi:hypothetical protein